MWIEIQIYLKSISLDLDKCGGKLQEAEGK